MFSWELSLQNNTVLSVSIICSRHLQDILQILIVFWRISNVDLESKIVVVVFFLYMFHFLSITESVCFRTPPYIVLEKIRLYGILLVSWPVLLVSFFLEVYLLLRLPRLYKSVHRTTASF